MQTVTITTSQNIEIDYEVAGLGERIIARIVDHGVFMGMYILCLISVFGYTSITDQHSNPFENIGVIIIIIVWLTLWVFYDLLTEIFLNGQSLGKRAVKIKVISLNGARPSISQYLLRWIFRIVDFGITFGTAAIVSVAVSDNKQRIGDIVAGTTLIKTSPRTKFDDLIFHPPAIDYEPTYPEVSQLTDQDIVLIHEVIKNFNRTRNNDLVYKLALQIKDNLKISYPATINEYQFLEIIFNDYNCLTTKNEI